MELVRNQLSTRLSVSIPRTSAGNRGPLAWESRTARDEHTTAIRATALGGAQEIAV